MTINERVRLVRRQLKLTQQEFGEKIAVAQNYLSNIEQGYRDVTEKIIKIICSEFSVNENWLRYGQGEMFAETKESFISELIKRYNLDDLDKAILKSYIALPAEERTVIKKYIQSVAKSFNDEVSATVNADNKSVLEAEEKYIKNVLKSAPEQEHIVSNITEEEKKRKDI